jgi:hypothetical protein
MWGVIWALKKNPGRDSSECFNRFPRTIGMAGIADA